MKKNVFNIDFIEPELNWSKRYFILLWQRKYIMKWLVDHNCKSNKKYLYLILIIKLLCVLRILLWSKVAYYEIISSMGKRTRTYYSVGNFYFAICVCEILKENNISENKLA